MHTRFNAKPFWIVLIIITYILYDEVNVYFILLDIYF